MNKDVIYIEPEDDITDIITKIEKSKEKIVALVPPKKAGVFRSIVNIKLIAKAGASAEKSVVLVTVDPSITKLAAATKLPVAKNLQSAPVIPEIAAAETAAEQTIEDTLEEPTDPADDDEKITKDDPSEATTDETDADSDDTDSTDDAADDTADDAEDEPPLKKSKKDKKSAKSSGNKILDWIKSHKKTTIFIGIFLLGVIGFLIWAFGFAPAVDISVAIKAESKNFSEGITFTDQLSSEDAKTGKFYLEQKKYENTQEVNFEATGQKNVGEKASGELVVYTYFKESGQVPVSEGTIFTYDGLKYTATSSVTLAWNGTDDDACDNAGQASSLVRSGCLVSGRISVIATNGGANYNVGASTNGWSTVADVNGVYSDKAMTGGTDDIKTVVQQSDVEKAKGELTTAKEEENKQKLYESIGDEYFIIDSSFEQATGSVETTPGVDQEVTEGQKPVLKATTTATVYVINKDKMKEFIREKADLADDQKVYDVKDIYLENFTNNGANSTAKMKAQYYIGPKITETEVVDKVKGKGLGDAQREIRDIYGVSDVRIDTSYPWVMAVPGDSNKVTVSFEVKDQDGKEVKEQADDEKTNQDSDAKESSDSTENTKEDN